MRAHARVLRYVLAQLSTTFLYSFTFLLIYILLLSYHVRVEAEVQKVLREFEFYQII